MMSHPSRTGRILSRLGEALLLMILALALGKDISEAQAKCNTAYNCAAACVNAADRAGSREVIETTKRFTTGDQELKCGDFKGYTRVNCAGNPAVTADAKCASNCCK